MPVLRLDPAPHPVTHEYRNQRHGEERRSGHGIGLGEGERLEQPPLLRLQGEDWHERNGDDEQGEEERRADFLRSRRDDFPVRSSSAVPGEVLVGVLHHDDAGVDHGPDRHGDAAEGHDVDVEPLQPHHDEGDENAHRQGDDGDEAAPYVEQEYQADEPYDQQLLAEADAEALDRALDQRGQS